MGKCHRLLDAKGTFLVPILAQFLPNLLTLGQRSSYYLPTRVELRLFWMAAAKSLPTTQASQSQILDNRANWLYLGRAMHT
jgi:hypothetical protein